MKNPTAWIIIVALVILGGSLWWKNSQKNAVPPSNPTTNPTGIVVYFGDTCPHCKIVEEFINNNKINEKVTFEQKEVYNNQANAKEMTEHAKTCNMDVTDGVPVPFLWDGQKCLIGQDEVIAFFKDKAGIK